MNIPFLCHGFPFPPRTDDLRESPIVMLAEEFVGKGLDLLIRDPDVRPSRLLGANSRFIEEHIAHIGAHLRADLENVVADSELVVAGLGSPVVLEARGARYLRPDQTVPDLVRIPERFTLPARVVGLCW